MFLNGQKQQQRQSNSNLQTALKNIVTIHQQPEFQNLIQLLHRLCLIYNSELQRDIHTPDRISDITFDAVRHQSERIILKNQKLKEKILIIRAKLSQLQTLSQSLNSNYSLQERQSIQSIKNISSQIKTKIITLKQKRYLNKQAQNKDQSNAARRSPKKYTQKNISPSLVSVEQMKRGTEFMAKTLITTKYDMEVTEKLIKIDNALNKK